MVLTVTHLEGTVVGVAGCPICWVMSEHRLLLVRQIVQTCPHYKIVCMHRQWRRTGHQGSEEPGVERRGTRHRLEDRDGEGRPWGKAIGDRV